MYRWWRAWRLASLQRRFPEWDIRLDRWGAVSVYREPVRRIVVGGPARVRKDLRWLNTAFENGVYSGDEETR